jgi:hypothetical protein
MGVSKVKDGGGCGNNKDPMVSFGGVNNIHTLNPLIILLLECF